MSGPPAGAAPFCHRSSVKHVSFAFECFTSGSGGRYRAPLKGITNKLNSWDSERSGPFKISRVLGIVAGLFSALETSLRDCSQPPKPLDFAEAPHNT
jgi:hypothetical protein